MFKLQVASHLKTSRKRIEKLQKRWSVYSSSEEELGELLRCQIVRQPQTFAKRRLLQIEILTEFRQTFLFPV